MKKKFNSRLFLEKLASEKGIAPKNIVNLDESDVINRCCENLLGFKPTPLGISHFPLRINFREFYIPLATTEGCLVASMCRGIKLLNKCDLQGFSENIGITRSFSHEFFTFDKAIEFYKWLKIEENVKMLIEAGNKGSKYCKIIDIEPRYIMGRQVFIKVTAYTGDAMGMNMITKACCQISMVIEEVFSSKLITISANICTDKKHSSENIINGRGRRVFLYCKISKEICQNILKVDIKDLKRVFDSKMLGSKLVGAGFNCQASNYVSGIFLALNQDLGQVIESSNATLEIIDNDEELDVSLFMPSVIVGTIGGGTHLEPSSSFLKQFQIKDDYCYGGEDDNSNSTGYFSLAVAGAVLAGELSLLASLTDNSLMRSHLEMNRATG